MTQQPARPFLPYARQSIDEEDIAAVVEVLRSDWLTTGPTGRAFEAALADRLGCRHVTVCASGTAALHLAYLAADIGPGDAVIVPSITFLATANAARMTGADVVFADIDPDSGLMTASNTAQAIDRAHRMGLRVKAIVPVHLAGQCGDLPSIAALAAEHDAIVIEDACHALGTTTTDRAGAITAVGGCAYSRMTVFSFHAVKNVAAGEGGAVTTNEPGLKARLDRLRNHRADRTMTDDTQPWFYAMAEIGFNYRLSDIHAALAMSQLKRLDAMIACRQTLVDRYDSRLVARGNLVRAIKRMPGVTPAWHLYLVMIDFDALGIERGTVMTRLRQQGISTQVHYIPVHRQPYYRARYPDTDLPGADCYYRRTLSLPLFAGMALGDADRVADALHDVLVRQTTRLAS